MGLLATQDKCNQQNLSFVFKNNAFVSSIPWGQKQLVGHLNPDMNYIILAEKLAHIKWWLVDFHELQSKNTTIIASNKLINISSKL
jgi:hypothetical protein